MRLERGAERRMIGRLEAGSLWDPGDGIRVCNALDVNQNSVPVLLAQNGQRPRHVWDRNDDSSPRERCRGGVGVPDAYLGPGELSCELGERPRSVAYFYVQHLFFGELDLRLPEGGPEPLLPLLCPYLHDFVEMPASEQLR